MKNFLTILFVLFSFVFYGQNTATQQTPTPTRAVGGKYDVGFSPSEMKAELIEFQKIMKLNDELTIKTYENDTPEAYRRLVRLQKKTLNLLIARLDAYRQEVERLYQRIDELKKNPKNGND